MLKAKELVEYCKEKIDTPYFYSCKMEMLTNDLIIKLANKFPSIVTPSYIAKVINRNQIGKINTDDAGLISSFTNKSLSSAQLYSTAKMRLSLSTVDEWADGVIAWRTDHIGVFYHNLNNEPIIIEAKDINNGVVFSKFNPEKWKCGLTFNFMEYSYNKSVADKATYRSFNPYKKPNYTLIEGDIGEGVKWLQFELIESGYNLSITGAFDKKTLNALLNFKRNTYLNMDDKVKEDTINALLIEGDK